MQRARTGWLGSLAFMTLCLVLNSACLFGDLVFDYTKEKPAEADVVGRWVATRATLQRISDAGYDITKAGPVIVLREDHTYEITNMPDWWYRLDGQPRGSLRGSWGKWELSRDSERGWAVTLDGTASGWLYLRKQRPPYYLYRIVGDPDDDVGMSFQRSSAR